MIRKISIFKYIKPIILYCKRWRINSQLPLTYVQSSLCGHTHLCKLQVYQLNYKIVFFMFIVDAFLGLEKNMAKVYFQRAKPKYVRGIFDLKRQFNFLVGTAKHSFFLRNSKQLILRMYQICQTLKCLYVYQSR